MTRQEIKKASVVELALRFFYLLFVVDRGNDEAGVNLTELEEVVAIDKELRKQLKENK